MNRTTKTEFQTLEEIEQKTKDCILDDVIYYVNNIDFTDFLKISVDELYCNFIISEDFKNLSEPQKEVCIKSYRNLIKLNDAVEQFQKENKIYRYSE